MPDSGHSYLSAVNCMCSPSAVPPSEGRAGDADGSTVERADAARNRARLQTARQGALLVGDCRESEWERTRSSVTAAPAAPAVDKGKSHSRRFGQLAEFVPSLWAFCARATRRQETQQQASQALNGHDGGQQENRPQ